jgi:hypothetical protein
MDAVCDLCWRICTHADRAGEVRLHIAADDKIGSSESFARRPAIIDYGCVDPRFERAPAGVGIERRKRSLEAPGIIATRRRAWRLSAALLVQICTGETYENHSLAGGRCRRSWGRMEQLGLGGVTR